MSSPCAEVHLESKPRNTCSIFFKMSRTECCGLVWSWLTLKVCRGTTDIGDANDADPDTNAI
jgi:hypothetical protein